MSTKHSSSFTEFLLFSFRFGFTSFYGDGLLQKAWWAWSIGVSLSWGEGIPNVSPPLLYMLPSFWLVMERVLLMDSMECALMIVSCGPSSRYEYPSAFVQWFLHLWYLPVSCTGRIHIKSCIGVWDHKPSFVEDYLVYLILSLEGCWKWM